MIILLTEMDRKVSKDIEEIRLEDFNYPPGYSTYIYIEKAYIKVLQPVFKHPLPLRFIHSVLKEIKRILEENNGM